VNKIAEIFASHFSLVYTLHGQLQHVLVAVVQQRLLHLNKVADDAVKDERLFDVTDSSSSFDPALTD
jgi:hypothetical protein